MQNRTASKIVSPKDFSCMVVGQIISILGSALIRFALSLYVLDLTGRADIFATLFAISNIALLLAPLGGAMADRFHRRNLMVIFDFISSAIVFLYCFYLFTQNVSLIFTGVVMVLLSIISAMYQPTVFASIPLLVEASKLEQANGIVNGVQALSNVAAPVIGGVLYGIVGIKALVFVSAVAFLGSAMLELFIYIPFVPRKRTAAWSTTLQSDLKCGFMYIRQKPLILKAMLLAAVLNLVLTPFFVVGGPIILKVILHSSDSMYGIGMGVINFATILGAFMIGVIASRLQMKTLYQQLFMITAFMFPMAITVAPFMTNRGFYPSYFLFLICAVPIAMIMTVISIYVITKVQKETPNELLGKVMATIAAVSQCAAPAGQCIYGIILQKFQSNLYLPILCIGLVLLLISIGTKRVFSESQVDICCKNI